MPDELQNELRHEPDHGLEDDRLVARYLAGEELDEADAAGLLSAFQMDADLRRRLTMLDTVSRFLPSVLVSPEEKLARRRVALRIASKRRSIFRRAARKLGRRRRLLRGAGWAGGLAAAAAVFLAVALRWPATEAPHVPGRAEQEPPPADTLPPRHHAARVASAGRRTEYAATRAETWYPAHEGTRLFAGDRVRAGPSTAKIEFVSGSVVWLRQGARVALGEKPGMPDLFVEGEEVYVETVPAHGDFSVRTPHGRAVVWGTRFGVDVSASGTTVAVLEGNVEVSTDVGAAEVGAGHEVLLAGRNGPPGPVRPARDLEARFAWATGRPSPRLRPAMPSVASAKEGGARDMRVALEDVSLVGDGVWEVLGDREVAQRKLRRTDDAFLLFGGEDWRDYVVSARVRILDKGGSSYGVGLVGYWIDQPRMLRVRWHGKWELTRSYDVNYDVLAETPAALPPGSDIRIKFRLQTTERGTLMQARVWQASEHEPMDWTLEAVYPGNLCVSGRAGFWCFNCRATFSETKVRGNALAGEDPKGEEQ